MVDADRCGVCLSSDNSMIRSLLRYRNTQPPAYYEMEKAIGVPARSRIGVPIALGLTVRFGLLPLGQDAC